MKRIVLALGLAMMPVASAFAAEGCGVYTLETRPPGEKVARMGDERQFTIEEQGASIRTYELHTSGTGIPIWQGVPTKKTKGKPIQVLEFKDGLVIDMMPYVAFCPP